ncbi:MAG: hypothetical protein ACFE7R_10220, partial [Candidatus Hodarchaeota archaeon]
VSVLDLDCIDMKKLAKIKGPRRRILIVPDSEEPSPMLETLDGWAIWHTSIPMWLAMIDNQELIVAGSEEDDVPLAVASVDASYLRMYRDYIGPSLTSSRRTS